MGRDLYSEQRKILIDMKGIGRDYSGDNNVVMALREIDINIMQGEFIGIMGPSASGKSTLLNIMGCLDTPTYGQYQLDGKNITKLSKAEKVTIRNKIFGYVFQAFHLLPELDVAANVALPLKYGKTPKKEWRTLIDEALEAVGLKEVKHRYPDQLSGGQQQRVAIARALVNKPDIILADEPTGNLDTATGQDIMEELKRLKEQFNRTIVVITHDSRIAGYADRIIRIEDGRIKEDTILNKAPSIVKNPFSEFGEEEYNDDLL